eukprot:scaffold5852_cov68-Skeletonema_dohrnii-CCMP3373.AAC.3
MIFVHDIARTTTNNAAAAAARDDSNYKNRGAPWLRHFPRTSGCRDATKSPQREAAEEVNATNSPQKNAVKNNA